MYTATRNQPQKVAVFLFDWPRFWIVL